MIDGQDPRQFMRRMVREAGQDLTAAGVMEHYNCRTAEIDDNGDIWIADPMTGHWLDTDHLAEHMAWELRR